MSIKKCKGTGIAKGYGCGNPLPYSERGGIKTYKAKFGLGLSCCYAKWLYTTKEGKEQIEKATLKVTKPRRELQEHKDRLQAERKLSTLLLYVRERTHLLVRIRDKGKPCISCGQPWNKDFQAGHFYKAELYSSLRFDTKNIHGQCQYCNLRKEGNENGYRLGLKERFGEAILEELDSKAEAYRKSDFKWSKGELIQLLEEVNKEIERHR